MAEKGFLAKPLLHNVLMVAERSFEAAQQVQLWAVFRQMADVLRVVVSGKDSESTQSTGKVGLGGGGVGSKFSMRLGSGLGLR